MDSFKRIAIVGVGMIGGSIAATIRRKRIETTIIGIDSPEGLRKGVKLGLIDVTIPRDRLAQGVSDADLVILAIPVGGVLDILNDLVKAVTPGTIITDVGSTKQEIVTRAQEVLPPDALFIGSHPMAGSERRGVENADPLLFETAIWTLTPEPNIPQTSVNRLSGFLSHLGARVVVMTAEQHDRVTAVVSHLPQLIAVGLMNYAAANNRADSTFFTLAAGGFRDLTRIASSPFPMWRDILRSNSTNLKRVLAEFTHELNQLGERLSEPAMERHFDAAAQSRKSIRGDTRGFVNPFYDATVIVEDKPGELARITSLLADEAINIKDIEILKVREGEAGNLRLAFASQEEREKAAGLLKSSGYAVSLRD